jgi:hypothetical protein
MGSSPGQGKSKTVTLVFSVSLLRSEIIEGAVILRVTGHLIIKDITQQKHYIIGQF